MAMMVGMEFRRWFGIGVLPLLFFGCSYPLVQHGEVQLPLTAEIKKETVKERGLAFQAPVSIEYSRKEQTKKLLRQIIDRDYTPEEMENLQKAFLSLGLIDEADFDINKIIDLYVEQAAGFYDPITKKLYLTDWLNKKDVLVSLLEFVAQKDLSGELLLSHELTHALQDQHYDLEKFIMEDKDNLDMILARHAVTEGDATAVGFNVVAGRYGKSVQASPELPRLIQKEAKKLGSGFGNLSPIVREQLLFPYYGGLYFTREVLVARGWTGMDAVYKKPPRSTEQILHPEKFLKVVDEPKPLKKPSLDFLKKAGHRFIMASTLGELGTQILLAEYVGKKKSAAASEGWGNDFFSVWEDQEKFLPFVWVTVWDSDLDAKEFFDLYPKLLLKRREKEEISLVEEKKNLKVFQFEKNRLVRVEKIGNSVLIVEGFPAEITKQIASSLHSSQ